MASDSDRNLLRMKWHLVPTVPCNSTGSPQACDDSPRFPHLRHRSANQHKHFPSWPSNLIDHISEWTWSYMPLGKLTVTKCSSHPRILWLIWVQLTTKRELWILLRVSEVVPELASMRTAHIKIVSRKEKMLIPSKLHWIAVYHKESVTRSECHISLKASSLKWLRPILQFLSQLKGLFKESPLITAIYKSNCIPKVAQLPKRPWPPRISRKPPTAKDLDLPESAGSLQQCNDDYFTARIPQGIMDPTSALCAAKAR